MKTGEKIMVIMICTLLCCLIACGFFIQYEYETTQQTHYISMKWIERQLLDTDYYFEFDNTTEFLIDSEFRNPSYIYHKHEIGDTISYNITRLVR